MAQNDVYAVQMFSYKVGRDFLNTFYYREDQAETAGNPAEELARAFYEAFHVAWMTMSSNQTTLGGTITRCIQNVGDTQPSDRSYWLEQQGIVSSEALPDNMGLRIRMRGTHNGRTTTGSVVIGGLPETALNLEGLFDPAFLNGPVAAFVAILKQTLIGTAPSTGTWKPGFMSRSPVVTPGPPIAWPGDFIPATNHVASPSPSVMLSRQSRHRNLFVV